MECGRQPTRDHQIARLQPLTVRSQFPRQPRHRSQRQAADAAFVNEVKLKQAALENKWVATAESRGLKNARAVLEEFRAEIQKVK